MTRYSVRIRHNIEEVREIELDADSEDDAVRQAGDIACYGHLEEYPLVSSALGAWNIEEVAVGDALPAMEFDADGEPIERDGIDNVQTISPEDFAKILAQGGPMRIDRL